MIAGSSSIFLVHRKEVLLMSCTNKILISFWPRTRKISQFLQVGKAVNFDSPWSRVGHALRPLFMLWFVKIWQLSSCGKFMQHLETCLLIAEVFFFHWMYKMKYTCFQDSSVIHVWFVYWVFGWKCAICLSHWKSDFGWHRVRLAWCVRGLKSYSPTWWLQELQHRDW